MSKSNREAIAMVVGLSLAAILMIWLASGRTACVKVGNEAIFVNDLIPTKTGIVYTHNGIRHNSDNTTYVYADNPESCAEIFPKVINE